MKSKMKKREWIFLAASYVACTAILQFFRFKFGLFEISAAFLVVSRLLLWFLERLSKPDSSYDKG